MANWAASAGLNYSYYLIDSWWYGEGSTPKPDGGVAPGYGGTWRWDDTVARHQEIFPSGLKALVSRLGAPLVMHMGQWVGSGSAFGAPPYSHNASWKWVVEAIASIPDPLQSDSDEPNIVFWDWLFGRMKALGLAVYKLDHTQSQMPNMQSLITRIGATEKWLRGMAIAAAKHGVAKQYGGHISSAFLHSLMLPNANQARVSDDYIPAIRRPANACTTYDPAAPPLYPGARTKGNLLLGRWSLYPWAMGIRPYKDAFFSSKQRWVNTTCFFNGQHGPESTGYLKPEVCTLTSNHRIFVLKTEITHVHFCSLFSF